VTCIAPEKISHPQHQQAAIITTNQTQQSNAILTNKLSPYIAISQTRKTSSPLPKFPDREITTPKPSPQPLSEFHSDPRSRSLFTHESLAKLTHPNIQQNSCKRSLLVRKVRPWCSKCNKCSNCFKRGESPSLRVSDQDLSAHESMNPRFRRRRIHAGNNNLNLQPIIGTDCQTVMFEMQQMQQ
jgi:hypothetical protein